MLLADNFFFLRHGQLGPDRVRSRHAKEQEQWKAATDHIVRLPAASLGSSGALPNGPSTPFTHLLSIKRTD